MSETYDQDRDAMHDWFGLSYANYLTIPRSVIQSMPGAWQRQMVDLLHEMEQRLEGRGLSLPVTTVQPRGPSGQFAVDWFADYQRGRRNVFAEGDVLLVTIADDAP